MVKEKHKIVHKTEVISRWVDLFALSTVAILICVLLDQQLLVFSSNLEKLFGDWNSWVSIPIAVMFTALLWYILGRLGGACFSGFFAKKTIFNPPVWLIGVFSFIIYFLLKLYLFKDGEYYRTDVIVKAIGITLGIFALGGGISYVINLIVCGYTEGSRRVKTDTDLNSNAPDFDEVIKNPSMLIGWIQKEEPIEKPSQDYFDFEVFAQRIVSILQGYPLKTIGLVGPNGCGKTSVLNMVEHYIQNPSELDSDIHTLDLEHIYQSGHIITCWVSGWGFTEGTAVEHILQAAIHKLSNYIDCLGLKSLPSHYQRTMANSGSIWSKMFAALLSGWWNPSDVLRKLDAVLGRINRRLVIFLEDIDRNKRSHIFYNEISSLLDGLKGLDNVSFVLAIGQEYKAEEVLIKTSEHIETIPKLSRRKVINMCGTFRTHCLSMLDDHCKCVSEEKRDERMGMGRSDIVESIVDIEDLLEKSIDSIASLLISPRVAKATLRRTWQAWQTLCGEIDFDDLLMVNVLRTGAPEAFIFVNEKIELLRSFPSTSDTSEATKRKDKNREKLHAEFKKVTEEVEWNFEAVNKLINDLFPGWYASGSLWDITLAARLGNCQHVTNSEPTDYWNRLMREKLSSDEIHDQEVMHALEEWKQNNEAKVYKGLNLPQAIFEVENFADKIEQFGMFLDGNEVRCIAGELFKLILAGQKVTVKADRYFGFTQLWRLSLDKRVDNHGDWILEEIRKALPISLRFANDLYYYWRHQERGDSSADVPTPELRRRVVEAAKTVYADNAVLIIKALDADFMYCIHHLAKLFSRKKQGGTGFQAQKWKWLGNVLLKAAIKEPKVVVPQIVALLVDSASEVKGGNWVYPCKFNEDEALKIFGEEGLKKLMPFLIEDIVNHSFDEQGKSMVECTRSYARKWLSDQGDAVV